MVATLSQAGLAAAWGQGCYHGTKLRIVLYGGGVVTVHPVLGDAVLAFDAVCRYTDYPIRPPDTGGFCCRSKTGQPGVVSNHGRAIAIDVNWLQNPYSAILHTDIPPETRSLIKLIRTMNGKQVWTWGGDWRGNKDSMHWEPGCGPRDLATGIDPRTVPTVDTSRTTTIQLSEEDDVTPEQWDMIQGINRKLDNQGSAIASIANVLGLERETALIEPIATRTADKLRGLFGR